MFDGIGKAIEVLVKFALFSVFVLVPLSIWKLIEIMVWIIRHVSISFVVALLLAAPAWAKYPYPYSTAVEVFNGNAGGSATLVGVSQGRGLLLSVWHVFEDGVRSPVCRFPDSTKRIRCHVLALDQHLDLAAIESDSIEGTSTAFRVRAVRRDDGALQAVGYPFYARDESGPHFTKGRFLRMDGDNLLAAFKPCVHSGFSGGGVFSLDGSLVGVVSGYNDRQESIACSGPALERFVSRWLTQGAAK